MAAKTVPLSVRVTDADAEFLARLEIPGATTPSEKMRAILAAERGRSEGASDIEQAFVVVHELLRPAQRRIRSLEAETGATSDFVRKLYDRLAEIVASAVVGPPEHADRTALAAFEARLLDRAFAFIQEVLELGLLARSRCYDHDAIASRLGPVLELVELIRLSADRRKGGSHG